MTAKNDEKSCAGLAYLVIILAWLVPGAGHWFIGQKKRGIIIFIAIVTLFILGTLLGSIEMVTPACSKPWFCAQILAGLPAVVAKVLEDPNTYAIPCRGIEYGQVYTGVAGMLNLLCALDALLRCHLSGSQKPVQQQ